MHTIYGTLISSNGQVRTNTKIKFFPESTPFTESTRVYTSVKQEVTTDGSGDFSIVLSPGRWRVIIGQGSNDQDVLYIEVPGPSGTYAFVTLLTEARPVLEAEAENLGLGADKLKVTLGDSQVLQWVRSGDIHATRTRVAVLGNYGFDSAGTAYAAAVINNWQPAHVVTAGDNNQGGGAGTIDTNVGKYFQSYMKPYSGGYGTGSADTNRFWPCPGNHDWGNVVGVGASLTPYLNYFGPCLPTNSNGHKRYYSVVLGDAKFYFLDSSPNEPDGVASGSTQYIWLRNEIIANRTKATRQAKWNIVVFHHAPISSENGYPASDRVFSSWDFSALGADLIISGSAAIYERGTRNGVPHINVGNCGAPLGTVGSPHPTSIYRYADAYGAVLLDYNSYSLKLRFCNSSGEIKDSVEISGTQDETVVYPCLKLNTNKGLKVGASGLEVDFENLGFANAIYAKIMALWAGRTGTTPGTGTGGGGGNYVYVAYASSDTGTDFTLTFDANLDYIAFLVSTTPLTNPQVTDFSGLWVKYKNNALESPARTVYLDQNATELAAQGFEAYDNFTDAYTAADSLQQSLGGSVAIQVGVGSFYNLSLTTAWNSNVRLRGLGSSVSVLGSVTITNTSGTEFVCNIVATDCTFSSINCTGTAGSTVNLTLSGGSVWGSVRFTSNLTISGLSIDGGQLTTLEGGSSCTVSSSELTFRNLTVTGAVTWNAAIGSSCVFSCFNCEFLGNFDSGKPYNFTYRRSRIFGTLTLTASAVLVGNSGSLNVEEGSVLGTVTLSTSSGMTGYSVSILDSIVTTLTSTVNGTVGTPVESPSYSIQNSWLVTLSLTATYITDSLPLTITDSTLDGITVTINNASLPAILKATNSQISTTFNHAGTANVSPIVSVVNSTIGAMTMQWYNGRVISSPLDYELNARNSSFGGVVNLRKIGTSVAARGGSIMAYGCNFNGVVDISSAKGVCGNIGFYQCFVAALTASSTEGSDQAYFDFTNTTVQGAISAISTASYGVNFSAKSCIFYESVFIYSNSSVTLAGISQFSHCHFELDLVFSGYKGGVAALYSCYVAGSVVGGTSGSYGSAATTSTCRDYYDATEGHYNILLDSCVVLSSVLGRASTRSANLVIRNSVVRGEINNSVNSITAGGNPVYTNGRVVILNSICYSLVSSPASSAIISEFFIQGSEVLGNIRHLPSGALLRGVTIRNLSDSGVVSAHAIDTVQDGVRMENCLLVCRDPAGSSSKTINQGYNNVNTKIYAAYCRFSSAPGATVINQYSTHYNITDDRVEPIAILPTTEEDGRGMHLPGANEEDAYSYQLVGKSCYTLTWSATGLPGGLTCSSGGLISGTLDALTAGTYLILVKATGGNSEGYRRFVLDVAPSIV